MAEFHKNIFFPVHVLNKEVIIVLFIKNSVSLLNAYREVWLILKQFKTHF